MIFIRIYDPSFFASCKSYDFIVYFIGVIIKSVLDGSSLHQKNEIATPILPDSVLITQYKEVIREQSSQIQKLNQLTESLVKEKNELEV